MASPTISVITATAGGRLDLLERKLVALVGQDIEPTRIEWVIADDGGREPELESVVGRPAPFEVKVVRLPEPSGPGPARNAALEVAEGEIIYLSDDDCSPGPSTLGEHAEAVAGGDVVSIGGLRFEPEDGKETTWLARRANWWNVNGANTAVRADVLRDVGGFDETLRRNVDWDLLIRLADVAEEHAGATLRLRGRLESLDQALVGVLLAAEGVGSTTAQALSHSSEEASDDFAAAVAELSRLSGVQVDEASWRARSVEQPTVVVGVLEAVETYLVNERAARASHELHQPVPEESSDPAPVPSEDEGSGQGARACLKWGLYGTYIGWCY